MATQPSDGIDPRYPTAFQRGGAASAPVVDEPATVRGSAPAPPSITRGDSRARRDALADTVVPGVSAHDAVAHGSDGAVDENARHFELIVAGNPWLRSLWVVGVIATLAGFALTVYAEFAFSVPPPSGIYDPSVYVVPRIAEAVAQPLVIAGVIALVAATALRIVAWRPSRVTAVIAEK